MVGLFQSEYLGVWDYLHVYAGSMKFYVYLGYKVVCFHICSVLGNCGYIWGLW